MPKWRSDRFIQGHRLLLLLPHGPPGISLQSILADLEIGRRAFFRLRADLLASGWPVETTVAPDGRHGYYLGAPGPDLLRQLGIG